MRFKGIKKVLHQVLLNPKHLLLYIEVWNQELYGRITKCIFLLNLKAPWANCANKRIIFEFQVVHNVLLQHSKVCNIYTQLGNI